MYKRMVWLAAALAVTCVFISAAWARQPWQAPYTGEDATGADVLAFWAFSKDAPEMESSGKGYKLGMRGESRLVEGGVFGGMCLDVSRPELEKVAKPEGASAG